MPQNDFDIANQAGAAFRSDVNSALQALATLSSGATAPSTTYARMWWVDTTTNTLKQRNAANSAWIVRGTMDETLVLSRSSNTILGESDREKVLIATGSYTQTFTAAATLGGGWEIDVIVDSGVTLTLDPNASETIDGATTRAIVGPAQGRVVCTGSAFRTMGFAGFTAASQSDQETASSSTVAVTPGVQQFHPSALKGWAAVTISGGVPTLAANHNVSSIGDNGAGDFTVNWGTDFSSANYAVAGMMGDFASGSGGYLMDIASTTTIAGAAVRVNIKNSAGTNLDPPNRFTIMAAGDQ